MSLCYHDVRKAVPGEVSFMAKIRTQMQLDPADHARIKGFASRRGISMSAAVRMLIRQALGDSPESSPEKWERFMRAAGMGTDKEQRTDVARHHDKYLFEES